MLACSDDPGPTVAAERLVLRPLRPDDAPAIAAGCADFDVTRMTTRMPWPYRLEDAQGFIAAMAGADPARERVFAIEHPTAGLIGAVGLHTRDRVPELGYWIGREHWGRGYATEAARAALSWARDGWKKKLVVAGHFADNPASAAVLVKSGFLYTGDVEHRHSLARGEPAATRMMVWIA